MSPKSDIVQQYFASLDANDIDSSLALVSDDFTYELAEPRLSEATLAAVGYSDGGLNKAQYKAYRENIAKRCRDMQTSIDSVTESDTTVTIKARTKFSISYEDKGRTPPETVTKEDESPFTAVFAFFGDKIASVKAKSDPAFTAKYSA